MTTIKKIFSYDDEIDNDIVEFMEKIPSRKDSLYIRSAIRLLMGYMEAEGKLPTFNSASTKVILEKTYEVVKVQIPVETPVQEEKNESDNDNTEDNIEDIEAEKEEENNYSDITDQGFFDIGTWLTDFI